jgi:hypothetical protein
MILAVKNEKKDDAHELIQATNMIPQPTIVPNANFDVEAAVNALSLATSTTTADKMPLIEVTVKHSREQRKLIRDLYSKKHDWSPGVGKLVMDLKSATRNEPMFSQLLCSVWLAGGEFDSQQMNEAIASSDTHVMNELLCTRTNEELAAMFAVWQKKELLKWVAKRDHDLDNGVENHEQVFTDLEDILTHYGHGHARPSYNQLLLGLLKAKRPSDGPLDEARATSDGDTLMHVSNDDLDIRDESIQQFLDIFLNRSWKHLRHINGYLIAKKQSNLPVMIRGFFGDRSSTGEALRVIALFATKPYTYFGHELMIALKAKGTLNQKLNRLVAARADIDLGNIVQEAQRMMGDQSAGVMAWWVQRSKNRNDRHYHYVKLLAELRVFG